ncbi:DUF6368 family protein [Streptomyces paradoxus]|uniref:DUF6368 family protein n=1 Tax=Streptomyces paradoxus TaxID=66375 RepID=UPI003825BE71
MSGPTLVMELAEPLSAAALRKFRALMVGVSSHCAEQRPGFFDVNVSAERLGVEDDREKDRRAPFPLPLLGSSAADQELTGLPGLLGIAEDDGMALGTAELLRAWVGHPAFRLVK